MKRVLVLVVAAGCAAVASADLIWSDNFDSYVDQAALNAVYTETAVGAPILLDQTKGHSDGQSVTGGIHSAAPHPRSYMNLGGEYAGTDAQPLSVKFWLDQSDIVDWWAREYIEIRGYEGAGYNEGALQELIALGMTSSGVPSTAKYSARIVSGAGWINLTQDRMLDWQEMEILIKSSTVEFYVNGALGASSPRNPAFTFDTIVLGAGLSSRVQVWFDDLEVSIVPEPAALALLAAGALFLRRR